MLLNFDSAKNAVIHWSREDQKKLRDLLNYLIGPLDRDEPLPRALRDALARVSRYEQVFFRPSHIAKIPRGMEKLQQVGRYLEANSFLQADVIEDVLSYAIQYKREHGHLVNVNTLLSVLLDYENWLANAFPSYWAAKKLKDQAPPVKGAWPSNSGS